VTRGLAATATAMTRQTAGLSHPASTPLCTCPQVMEVWTGRVLLLLLLLLLLPC